jgi:hypothetical protein
MNLSLLPKYPKPQGAESAADDDPTDRRLSPRAARILLDMAFLVAIVALLYWLRRASNAIERERTPAPAPAPVEFHLIMERLRHGGMMISSPEEAEALLGPPTERNAYGPDLDWGEEMAEREFAIPKQRFWYRWTDPKNKDRWVAILYAGPHPHERFYRIVMKEPAGGTP